MSDPIIIETTAAADEATPIIFRINDEEFKWSPPKAGTLIVAMMRVAGASRDPTNEQIMVYLDALNSIVSKRLDDADRGRFYEAMEDLEMADIMRLLEALVEAAAARPTQSPSD